MNRFALLIATSIDEAARESSTVSELMRHPEQPPGVASNVLKAGGIDLLDLMKENLLTPDRVVSLRDIPELKGIVGDENGLRIGAMETLAALANHPLVRARAAIVAQAAAASASPQIRNVATLGGNLLQRPRCWYFRAREFHCLRKGGDHCYALEGESQYHAVFDNSICAIAHPSTLATCLLALDASVELVDASGAMRKIKLSEFFVSPQDDPTRESRIRNGEILIAVYIPSSPDTSRCVWLKQGERNSSDWPLVDVAVCLDFNQEDQCTNATVVCGAVAPTPHRSRSSEALLVGRAINSDVARDAAHAALDGAMPLAKNAYKLPILEALLRRAIMGVAHAPCAL